jgi:hypothetical protein
MKNYLLPSTVKGIRLKHGIMQKRHQSHPRRIEGYLTVPQIAKVLDIPRHWIYDQIYKGAIHVTKDTKTGLFLFPDKPDILEQFQKLKAGLIHNLGC